MRSAYPSSYSFFDATSDSTIRAEDIQKSRTSASFSCLSDLFTNPSPTSSLFPNSRSPVFVPEEVRFPAKKKRECEERTSIWHEWGSGECQTENVAQESSGFSSDLRAPGDTKSSVLTSSSFPNLGSANISLLTEEFTFPARKKREEGSSWREERASFQDWSDSGAPKESTATERCPVVGSITDMYLSQPCAKSLDLLTNPKASPFTSLGAPARSTAVEVSFPARKKREERSFWQEPCLDGTQSDSDAKAAPRESTSGVSSLADMYLRKPGSKCSSLFPNVTLGSSEEVVFPKRRSNVDRNAWRDWTNTGYGDYEDETDPDSWCVDNSSRSTSSGSELLDASACTQVDVPACTGATRIDGSVSSGRISTTGNSPTPECEFRASEAKPGNSEVQVRGVVTSLSTGLVGNADESGCHGACTVPKIDRCMQFTPSEDDRTMDGAEPSEAMDNVRTGVDVVQETRFSNSRIEQGKGRPGKYPPPLRSLSRQGSSRLPHHMPWVHLQHIRSEGRFVLKEVKVTQPVVFQPFREEGRLVLQFIGPDNSDKQAHAEKRFHASPAIDEELTVDGKVDSNDSMAMKTEFGPKVEIEREEGSVNDSVAIKSEFELKVDTEGREGSSNDKVSTKTEFEPKIDTERKERPHVDDAGTLAQTYRKKKSSKVWPVIDSIEETQISGSSHDRSASVVAPGPVSGHGVDLRPEPPHGVPPIKFPEEQFRSAARGASVPDIWDKKLFNLREFFIMVDEITSSSDRRIPEREAYVTSDGGFTQERPQAWLLGKGSGEDRKFDARSLNNQLLSAVERLGLKGNVITIQRARETPPLRAHIQTLPRNSSQGNGPSGLNVRGNGELGSPTRSCNTKGSLSDFATFDHGKEEKMLDAMRDRTSDARISLSICQGIVRDSILSLATAHSFLRSLRVRPGIPGEPDSRLSNYPVAVTFSCADGMGERHQEKNFWEQLPCVS